MVPPQCGSPALGSSARSVMSARAGGEIGGIQQLADLSFHIARVGDVGPRVGKGQLDGLHHLVIVLGVLALFGQRQPVEHTERHQHRDAVAVGRDLADGVAAVVLRDGLDPFGVVVLEVVLAEVAARGARMGDDLLHQLAAVIALAVRLDEGVHRVGIGGETEDIARAVRRAVRLHKALPPVFIGGGVLRHDPGDALAVARPELADIDGHGIAVFGIGNGGGEELGERLCAKARIERGPARGAPGTIVGSQPSSGTSEKPFARTSSALSAIGATPLAFKP